MSTNQLVEAAAAAMKDLEAAPPGDSAELEQQAAMAVGTALATTSLALFGVWTGTGLLRSAEVLTKLLTKGPGGSYQQGLAARVLQVQADVGPHTRLYVAACDLADRLAAARLRAPEPAQDSALVQQ